MPLASTATWLITHFLIPLALFLGAILLAGIVPLRQRTRGVAIAAELGAHAAGWIVVFAYAAIWIPQTRKIFQDFGIELSSFTVLIIQITDLLAHPAAILIVSASMLAADGIIYSRLWGRDASPSNRNRFSVFMTLVPLFVMFVFGTAIILPLYRLVASIS